MKNLLIIVLSVAILIGYYLHRKNNIANNVKYNQLELTNDSLKIALGKHIKNAELYGDTIEIHLNTIAFLNNELAKNENRDIHSYLTVGSDEALQIFIRRAENYLNKR